MLQKLKYDIHIKVPLESIEFGMIPVTTWYEYHTSVFTVYSHMCIIQLLYITATGRLCLCHQWLDLSHFQYGM